MVFLLKVHFTPPPAQLLSYNTYDALGQLTSKKVGNTSASPLQKVDYTYNIRGWLTGINNTASLTDAPNDLFAFKLNYNTTASGLSGVTGLFNGNIAETYWKTAGDNNLRLYGYQYDGLNRLSQALYKNNNNGFANTYNESLTYDLNGNIKTLQRNGGTESTTAVAIDNLTYTYDATAKNKLLKVVDATNSTQGFKDDATYGNDTANDYTYDANGNMTVDQNKGITAIVYNHLNLPSKITFGTTGTINYLYDATGVKLQKKVTQGTTVTTTDYLGGYQYTNNVLDFFPTAEGYVKHTLASGVSYFNYVFNHTDHLGNVRVSYTKDPATGVTKIIEENHNYPFGLKHTYSSTDYEFTASGASVILSQVTENKYNYQYQGQERQDELNLNWDSFKWRNYDYAIGRFMCIDPLTEEYNTWSPYVFSGNRVVDARELEGLEPVPIQYYLAYIQIKDWASNLFTHNPNDSNSSGSREKAKGSGITISGAPFSGDSGRMIAEHSELNIEVPYEVVNQLGGWRDIPGSEPVNGMTDAVKKSENMISKTKQIVELVDEGMDAGEKVVNLIEKTGVLDTKLPQSKYFDKDGKMHGFSFYYYDKTNQTFYGSNNITQKEINKIMQRKDVIINPKEQCATPNY